MSPYFVILRNFIKSNSIVKKAFIKKIWKIVNQNRTKVENIKKDYKISSIVTAPMNLINIKMLFMECIDTNIMEYTSKMYLSHHFNILGSGWVSADYDYKPLGLEDLKYDQCLERVFWYNAKAKVDKNYKLIDWHRCMKTGYRFHETELSTQIAHNLPKGVDIKMPWELSRMYHLPQMALAANLKPAKRNLYLTEFRNQVYDFCESNPIGYGVNWSCTMEVAIRVVNLLVAYDIFVQLDSSNILNQDFVNYFSEKLMEHGKFIFKNLEINFSTLKNGNHYLSNLCGLLFIASYIKNKESKTWMEFSTKEFMKEFDNQFLEDGGNYECSTAYHRLSAEISAYCFALLIRNGVKIEKRLLEKLNAVGQIATMMIRKDGSIIQIGDNDSGRLLKLNLTGRFITVEEYEEQYINAAGYSNLYSNENIFIENELSIDPIIAIIYAITNYDALSDFAKKAPTEYNFMKAILHKNTALCTDVFNYRNLNKFVNKNNIRLPELSYHVVTQIVLPIEGLDLANTKVEIAPNFGLVVFTLDRIRVFVRSVVNLWQMQTAHVHNDFLHFEINIDDENYFSDQGSYIYTPLLDRRDEFRSIKAHNTPYHGQETNKFRECFYTDVNIRGFINEITNHTIGMIVYVDDIVHFRKIELNHNIIIVTDYSNKPFTYECKEFDYVSIGYGTMLKRKDSNHILKPQIIKEEM